MSDEPQVPVEFIGNWPEDQKAQIQALVQQQDEKYALPTRGYNFWTFEYDPSPYRTVPYIARRRTGTLAPIGESTFEALMKRLYKYYRLTRTLTGERS